MLDQQIKKNNYWSAARLSSVRWFSGLAPYFCIKENFSAHIRRCLQEKGEEEQKVFACLSAEFGAAISDNFLTLLAVVKDNQRTNSQKLYICIL